MGLLDQRAKSSNSVEATNKSRSASTPSSGDEIALIWLRGTSHNLHVCNQTPDADILPVWCHWKRLPGRQTEEMIQGRAQSFFGNSYNPTNVWESLVQDHSA